MISLFSLQRWTPQKNHLRPTQVAQPHCSAKACRCYCRWRPKEELIVKWAEGTWRNQKPTLQWTNMVMPIGTASSNCGFSIAMVVGRSVSPILHWNKCKNMSNMAVCEKNGPILGQVAYGTRPQEVVSTLNEVKCSSSNLNDSKGQSVINWSHKHQNSEQWKDENTKHVHQT